MLNRYVLFEVSLPIYLMGISSFSVEKVSINVSCFIASSFSKLLICAFYDFVLFFKGKDVSNWLRSTIDSNSSGLLVQSVLQVRSSKASFWSSLVQCLNSTRGFSSLAIIRGLSILVQSWISKNHSLQLRMHAILYFSQVFVAFCGAALIFSFFWTSNSLTVISCCSKGVVSASPWDFIWQCSMLLISQSILREPSSALPDLIFACESCFWLRSKASLFVWGENGDEDE